MSKLKSPILSLGAKGTIGDALTFQKRGRDTIARQKPTPTDPYSLPQAYQRWDYRDYAHLWTLLSNSEKQVYRTKASRYHITGFSQFMREHLKDLLYIKARWHLDEKAGATAYDSSKNTNNGVIIGASPITGVIDGQYLFDGLNDGIIAPHHSTLDLVSPFSIEFFFQLTQKDKLQYLLYKKGSWSIPLGITTKIGLDLAGFPTIWAVRLFTTDTLYHIVWTHDKDLPANNSTLFVNGVLDEEWNNPNEAPSSIRSLALGCHLNIANNPDASYLDGTMDQVILHSRILDLPTIKRHSERRYPAQ